MAKKLNEAVEEKVEKNFLAENPDEEFVDANEKVVVETHIPKMVKGIFINQRDPSCALQFHYKSKTHPLKHYTLFHGHEHELPEEVVEHLEGSNPNDPWTCHSRKYARKMRPDGVTETYADNYVPYFQFKRVRSR